MIRNLNLLLWAKWAIYFLTVEWVIFLHCLRTCSLRWNFFSVVYHQTTMNYCFSNIISQSIVITTKPVYSFAYIVFHLHPGDGNPLIDKCLYQCVPVSEERVLYLPELFLSSTPLWGLTLPALLVLSRVRLSASTTSGLLYGLLSGVSGNAELVISSSASVMCNSIVAASKLASIIQGRKLETHNKLRRREE